MIKVSEMLINHPVHSFRENGVFGLEEFLTRFGPLFYCLLDEFFGDDERIIIREFPCLRPALHLSDRMLDESQFGSPQCHIHDAVDVDGIIV